MNSLGEWASVLRMLVDSPRVFFISLSSLKKVLSISRTLPIAGEFSARNDLQLGMELGVDRKSFKYLITHGSEALC